MVWLRRTRSASAGLRKFFLQFKPNGNVDDMAKRQKSKGKSARHGRAPSPYQKYEKQPYRYSTEYYTWKTRVTGKAQRYVGP